jgi:hypothetical protein
MKVNHRPWAVLVPLAVAALALAACGSSKSPPAAASHTTSAPATPPAPALTAAQQQFVSDARSTFNMGASVTDSDLVGIASGVCAAAQANLGANAIDLVPAAQGLTFSGGEGNSAGAAQIVALAIKDTCPQYTPPPTVILRMSGSGIENSRPVLVTSSQLTVKYSYDCASMGTSNFIADFETTNYGNSANGDDQSIANTIGAVASDTTQIYPQNVGSDYYLAVIAGGCTWHVVIKSP